MASSALTAIALAAKIPNWWWAWPRGLRRQVVALEIEGSNPSAHPCARSSAERASVFGTEGRGFESPRARIWLISSPTVSSLS